MMSQISYSPHIIPVTEHVLLKQIELSDALDIFKTIDCQRSYLGKWLPFVDFTRDLQDSENYVRSVLDVPIEDREFVFVIHVMGVFAGLIGFKATDKLNKRTEIGYWLSEPFQKQGVMTESVKALMRFAYHELDIHRIQIKCAVGNFPSKSIPGRLGFQLEGVERDGELLSGGIYTDIEVYSKIKGE